MLDAKKEARDAYIRLLKATEELTPEQRFLAKEAFDEGWEACKKHLESIKP